jgi:exodeoxyribonuclease V gamma subunit
MPVEAACSYATSRFGGDAEVQALTSARHVWNNGFERTDEPHRMCWDGADLDALLGVPDATERVWWPEDGTRFGVLARRVWDLLLRHESVRAA